MVSKIDRFIFFELYVQRGKYEKENIKVIKKRLIGWQLESFEESYTYKIENGISLFKKNLKNE